MKLKTLGSLCVLGSALFCFSSSRADVLDSFDFSGASHAGDLGDSNNTLSTLPSSIGAGGYTIGEVRWNGHASPVQAYSWAEELMLQITHNSVPYDIQLGLGDYYDPGTPFSGSTYLLAGIEVAWNDSFTFEFYDTYDDGPGADATWDDLIIDFTNELPPVIDPVAPGYIRIDTRGSNPSDTTAGSAGENFWGIEYGADTDGLPAIESVQIIMAEDVRAADVTFDPYYPDGTFVANTLHGVTGADASFSHVDEDHPNNYGRMRLDFQSGDFLPGDSIRFGVALDGDYEEGSDMQLADPAIEIVITFEDQSRSVGYLTGLAASAPMNPILFSYVDIPVISAELNPADFNEDTLVDATDYAFWAAGFGTETGAAHRDGDADMDGDVDGSDFLIWQQNFGWGTASSTPTATAIPEPASAALVALAFAFLLPWRRVWAASAVLLMFLSTASATVHDTITLTDAPSNDLQGQVSVNYIEIYLSEAASEYTLGDLRWSGVAQAMEDATAGDGDPRFPSWGNELYARITHEDAEMNATSFDVPLGSGGWFWQEPVPFSGSIPHLAGLVIHPSDTITIELYESWDDIDAVGGSTDALWSNLTFEFTDENPAPAVTDPVADGSIRFSAVGYDSHSDDANASEFWRIEYGPDASGTLPAIESILIDVGDPDEISFDPSDPSGSLSYLYDDGYQTGIVDEDIVGVEVDEPATYYDMAFGQFNFTFASGAFTPGDEFRFGCDLDGAPKDGSLLHTLDTPIELTITFEDGSDATIQLTERGYWGPGEFQFSYGDVIVPTGAAWHAAVPEPAAFVILALGLLAGFPVLRLKSISPFTTKSVRNAG